MEKHTIPCPSGCVVWGCDERGIQFVSILHHDAKKGITIHRRSLTVRVRGGKKTFRTGTTGARMQRMITLLYAGEEPN